MSATAKQVDQTGFVAGMETPLDRSSIALDPAKPSTGLKVICRIVNFLAGRRLVNGPDGSLQKGTPGLLCSGMYRQSHEPPAARWVMTSWQARRYEAPHRSAEYR